MSDYVVIARFKEEADAKFNRLRGRLARAGYGVPEWPPHITIAAYENCDEAALAQWTSDFTSTHSSITVALRSLSILPPGGEHTEAAVLCLGPAHSMPLVDFYYAFHHKYEEYCTGIGRYNSIAHGHPIIHMTIATVKIAELYKVMELVFSSNVFCEAEIVALELYTYPMRLIRRFDL